MTRDRSDDLPRGAGVEEWVAVPDPTDGWADGRSPYLIDKQITGEARFVGGIMRPRWHNRSVRRAIYGLVFVVGVFVIAPVVAMFVTAS